MGRQTSVVVIGFLAVHIAFILSIISIATPDWMTSHQNKTNAIIPIHHNSSSNTTTTPKALTMGIWQECANEECRGLNITTLPEWHRATLGTYTSGTVLCGLAVALDYLFVLSPRRQTSKCLNSFIIVMLVFAVGLQLSSSLTWGLNATKVKKVFERSVVDAALGWSYWVAVGGLVCVVITMLCHLRQAAHLRNPAVGYVTLAGEP